MYIPVYVTSSTHIPYCPGQAPIGRSQLKHQNLRVGGYVHVEEVLKWFNYSRATFGSLRKNLAWWAVIWRTSKNHKTVKIGGWVGMGTCPGQYGILSIVHLVLIARFSPEFCP